MTLADVADVRARFNISGEPRFQESQKMRDGYTAVGYMEVGNEVVACVADWRGGGMTVECSTFVSAGVTWEPWSSGSVDYLHPTTESDDQGSIDLIVGNEGDIGELTDLYLRGVAGWCKGPGVTQLTVDEQIHFRIEAESPTPSYFAVPIITLQTGGPDVDISLRHTT